MTPEVIDFVAYANRDLIQELEVLLAAAQAGEITGIAYAIQCRSRTPGFGITGGFARNPFVALGAVSQLWGRIVALADREDG
jgi:hypothetical protein